MEIEARKQGKKIKYYLAHSFREGDKVRKIRRYLGSNLSKEKIEALRKRAEEIIQQQIASYKIIVNPLSQDLTKSELEIVKSLEKNRIKISHFSEKDWQVFTEIFTYNTNAIEGSEVNEKEVKDILEKDKWPENTKKFDISEVYGVAKAVRYIRETKEHLSIGLIKTLHKLIFSNSKAFAGKLRGKDVEVVIKDGFGNILHVGAPSNRVLSLLQELINWYNLNKNKYSPLLLAAIAHNQFENIHPFEDGNGRVGRLLLTNILLKHSWTPVNISFKNRKEYYNSLKEYQKGNIRPTLNLLLKEYKNLKKELGVYKNKKV